MELYQQGAAVSVFTYTIMLWVKKFISKRFLPVMSIIIGCFLSAIITIGFGDGDWKKAVISGLAGGASSMGIHDTMSSARKKRNKY